MTRATLGGPGPLAFQPDDILDGSNMQTMALDINVFQYRCHRPVCIFPVQEDYAQIGKRLEGDLANAAFPWQCIGVWYLEEEYDDTQIPLEAFVLVTAVSSTSNTEETWEFQWILDTYTGDAATDTVNGVFRNVAVYKGSDANLMSDIEPNTLEGRVLQDNLPYLTLLEFRGAEMPDLTAGGASFPMLISLQARAANDSTGYLNYHQKLYVYSVYIAGAAI